MVVHSIVDYANNDLIYIHHDKELSVEEVSKLVNIDPTRLHKSELVVFHLHDSTKEDTDNLSRFWAGNQKARLL